MLWTEAGKSNSDIYNKLITEWGSEKNFINKTSAKTSVAFWIWIEFIFVSWRLKSVENNFISRPVCFGLWQPDEGRDWKRVSPEIESFPSKGCWGLHPQHFFDPLLPPWELVKLCKKPFDSNWFCWGKIKKVVCCFFPHIFWLRFLEDNIMILILFFPLTIWNLNVNHF